jgi:integrase
MAVRQRGSSFVVDFMVKGKRTRETFDDETSARRWEIEAKAAIALGKSLPSVRNNRTDSGGGLDTLGQLYDYTVERHWRNNPKITAPDTAIRSGQKVVDFFGRNMPVHKINEDECKRLVNSVIDAGFCYATADRRLAALSKMLGFAVDKGVIDKAPKMPMSGKTGERLRFLTKEEAKQLLDLWLTWDQPELHAFTVFGIHTGARLGDLLGCKWKQFGVGYRTVIFHSQAKGSNIRTLPMSKVAIAAMETMRSRHPDSEGPFCHMKKDGHLRTMWDRMQDIMKWDDVVIHTLRHTCATWMLESSGNPRKVQQWLGHKRIETTMKYAKLMTGALDGMADAMDEALG